MWNVRMGNTWLGVTLIALGAAFFIQSYFGFGFRNWWALFILIPAIAAFSTGWYAWKAGHTATATSQFTIGLVVASVAAIFLLDIPWRLAWPVLFIVAGIGLLFPRLAGSRAP
jgi:hypothetical protein